MPARKPKDLNSRAETKAASTRRADGESAITPRLPFPVAPPPQLTGDVARRTWIEIVTIYHMLDARIVSLLDIGLLLDYCTASQQLTEIDDLRSVAMTNYGQAQKILDKATKEKGMDIKILANLTTTVNWSFDNILKLDSRVDNKRKMLHTMRQSLYLTPRSRAGFIPEEKPPKKPQSDMARIIDGEVSKKQKVKNNDVLLLPR